MKRSMLAYFLVAVVTTACSTPKSATNDARATPTRETAAAPDADGAAREETVAARPAANPSEAEEPAAIDRMTIEALRAQLDQGGLLVVDVRGDEAFAEGHIKGALPMSTLLAQPELARGKKIVTYCA